MKKILYIMALIAWGSILRIVAWDGASDMGLVSAPASDLTRGQVMAVDDPVDSIGNFAEDKSMIVAMDSIKMHTAGIDTSMICGAEDISVAFRTNLLLPLMNIGMEVPLGKHLSIGADYYYPWMWPPKTNEYCFEALAWNVDLRWWFGQNGRSLSGHSIGLDIYAGYYDYEVNYRGWQGEFYGAGLDYSYSLPIKKWRGRWDFSFGVGWVYSQDRPYKVYLERGTLVRDNSMSTNYTHRILPVKVSVALVFGIRRKGRMSR